MQIKDDDQIVEVSNLTTEELWDMTALFTTELSRRDDVQYRVCATPDSVKLKLSKLWLLWQLLRGSVYSLLLVLLVQYTFLTFITHING